MIDHRRALRRRRMPRLGDRRHQARARPCGGVVVRGPIAIGAAMPVAVDRCIDEARIFRGHRRIVELHAFERVKAKAGDEDVGPLDQLERETVALGAAQIDCDRALVAIVELKRRTDARVRIAHRASDKTANRIAGLRIFKLDNVGAPVAQHRGGGGPGHPHRKFHDSDALERTVHHIRLLHWMKSNCYHGEGGCAMPEHDFDVVTGAWGYTGRYITRLLLSRGRRVRTLTGHPTRANPFGDQIESAPFNFDRADELARSLEGARTVFNSYWIRFPYGGQT